MEEGIIRREEGEGQEEVGGEEEVVASEDDGVSGVVCEDGDVFARVFLLDFEHADLWVDEVVFLLTVACHAGEVTVGEADLGGFEIFVRGDDCFDGLGEEKF